MKTWKLPPPAKIADKLKSALLGEMANAEWELLEEKEWDDLAEGSRNNDSANLPTQGGASKTSSTTAMTGVDSTEVANDTTSTRRPLRSSPTPATTTSSTGNYARPSGTSGWTKLKSKQPGA